VAQVDACLTRVASCTLSSQRVLFLLVNLLNMASSSMAVDSKGAPTRPKIDVDGYLARAASSTPASLAPYFQAFGDLHHRKSVALLYMTNSMLIMMEGCGTS
jgi:hypothetical protein